MEREEAENTEGMREDAPRLTDFLGRGSLVTVSARTGVDLEGYVCDQNENGLLLDSRDPSGDPTGYEFLPWSIVDSGLSFEFLKEEHEKSQASLSSKPCPAVEKCTTCGVCPSTWLADAPESLIQIQPLKVQQAIGIA